MPTHQPLTSAHSGEKSADACGKRAGHLLLLPRLLPGLTTFSPALARSQQSPSSPQGSFPESLPPLHPQETAPRTVICPPPTSPARQFWGLEGGKGAWRTPRGDPDDPDLDPCAAALRKSPCHTSSTWGTLSPRPARLLVFAIVSRARRVVLADSQHLCVALQPYVGVLLAREFVNPAKCLNVSTCLTQSCPCSDPTSQRLVSGSAQSGGGETHSVRWQRPPD